MSGWEQAICSLMSSIASQYHRIITERQTFGEKHAQPPNVILSTFAASSLRSELRLSVNSAKDLALWAPRCFPFAALRAAAHALSMTTEEVLSPNASQKERPLAPGGLFVLLYSVTIKNI